MILPVVAVVAGLVLLFCASHGLPDHLSRR